MLATLPLEAEHGRARTLVLGFTTKNLNHTCDACEKVEFSFETRSKPEIDRCVTATMYVS